MKTPTDSPLSFPCAFPIKAMGKVRAGRDLDALVTGIVRRHAPDLGEGAVRTTPSRHGRYVSVTVTVQARSREQLDAIYQDLTTCDDIVMVL